MIKVVSVVVAEKVDTQFKGVGDERGNLEVGSSPDSDKMVYLRLQDSNVFYTYNAKDLLTAIANATNSAK